MVIEHRDDMSKYVSLTPTTLAELSEWMRGPMVEISETQPQGEAVKASAGDAA